MGAVSHMRDCSIDETSGPPVAVIAERCDTPGCDQRFVLPLGGLGFPVMPPTPRIAEMPAYLARAGWTQDKDLRWSCPHDGPVRALPANAAADREASMTQEFQIPDLNKEHAQAAEPPTGAAGDTEGDTEGDAAETGQDAAPDAEPDEAAGSDDPGDSPSDVARALAGGETEEAKTDE